MRRMHAQGTPNKLRGKGASLSQCDRNGLKQDLSALGFHVPSTFLWDPTAQDAEAFFAAAADYVLGTTDQRFAEAELAGQGLELLAELGSCHAVLNRLHVLRRSQRAMQLIANVEFTLRDLSHPDMSRVQFMCSSLLTFANFKKTQVASFASQQDNNDCLRSDIAAKEDMLQQLDNTLTALRVERCAAEAMEEQLHDAHAAAQTDIKSKHSLFSTSQSELRSANELSSQLSSKLKKIDIEIADCRLHLDTLDQQVVRSPRRLKLALSDLSQVLCDEQHARRVVETSLCTAKTRMWTAQTVERQMTSFGDLMNDLDDTLVKCENQLRDRRSAEQRLQAATCAVAHQREQLTAVEVTANALRTKLHNTNASNSAKLADERAEVQAAEALVADRKQELLRHSHEIDALETHNLEIQDNIDEITNMYHTAMKQCDECEDRISAAVQYAQESLRLQQEDLKAYAENASVNLCTVQELRRIHQRFGDAICSTDDEQESEDGPATCTAGEENLAGGAEDAFEVVDDRIKPGGFDEFSVNRALCLSGQQFAE